jgi:flagellar hook assembly protein FlgD
MSSMPAFNPSAGEKVAFHYQLAADAKVTFRVYDPDRDLVATLADKQPQAKGENQLVWEGRDLDGKIVPDEAYFVTIEAVDAKGQAEVYDPMVFSGGKEADLTQAEEGTYVLTVNLTSFKDQAGVLSRKVKVVR